MLTTVRELGAAIREARRAKGLSQAVLAERAGVGRQWLSRLETGSSPRAELRMVLDVVAALDLVLTLRPSSGFRLDADPFADLFDQGSP